MTPIQNAPLGARMLQMYMSDISENQWCAGWLGGLEFSLWEAMHKGETADFLLTEGVIADLKRLHELAGGWVMWDRKHVGEVFVTTEEWLKVLEERNGSGHSQTQE